MARVRYNLTNLTLNPGTYTVQVKATGAGHRDSEFSNAISYKVGYGITVSYAQGTSHGATAIGSLPVTVYLSANTGYRLPFEADISVSNATFLYTINNNVGELTLSNATGEVSVTAVGTETAIAATSDAYILCTLDNKQLMFNEE